MNDQKKRKFKGSVLFTVVFVMSILIVLLFGTLTLAYATNSRAHVNYSSAQTGITSRLVTESAIRAIKGNEDYAKAIAGLKSTSIPLKVKVSLSSDKDAALGTMGHGTDSHDIYTEISYVGTKEYYDTIDKEWKTRDLLKFTSTISQGGVDSTSTAYVLKHQLDDSPGGSSGGAGFVTTAGAALDCQSNLFGGSYINLPDWNSDIYSAYRTDDKELEFYEGAMYNIAYKENGEFKGGLPKIDEDALKLTNGNGSIIEADTYIYQNLDLVKWANFYFPDKDKGITIWGDLRMDTQAEDLKFVAGNNLKNISSFNFNEIPYIYVNRKISGGAVVLGNINEPFPLNVFCGSIDTSSANFIKLAADIYCMDDDASITNKIGSGSTTTKLYNWTASVVNQNEQNATENHVRGKICSNSNLELNKITVDGDVRVNGDCTIKGDVTINGDLIVAGNLKGENGKLIMGPGKVVYCANPDSITGLADLNTNDLKNQKFVQVPSITHDDSKSPYASEGVIEVTNQKQYEPFTVTENHYNDAGNVDGVIGYHGKNIGWVDIGKTIYYKIVYDENGYETVSEDWTWSDNGAPYLKTNVRIDSEEGGIIKYTLESSQTGTTKEKYYYDLWNKCDHTWKSKADINGDPISEDPADDYTDDDFTWYDRETGMEVSEEQMNNAVAGASTSFIKAPIGNYTSTGKSVYPEYAKRAALLGFDSSVTDRGAAKVVKTLSEVIEEVANPYEYSDITEIDEIKNLNIADLPVYTSVDDVGLYVSNSSNFTAPNIKFESTTDPNSSSQKSPYFNTSCIIDFANEYGSASGSRMVFDPGSSNMLVVIKNLKVGKGCSIYVDDSSGGKVYFYVADGGIFNHGGGNNDLPIISTLKYENVLQDPSTTAIKYNCDDSIDAVDIGKLGKPKVFICGGSNSSFTVTDTTYIVANIISPNLKVDIAGGNGMKINAAYYNNTEMTLTGQPNFILGCCNTRDAKIPNALSCLYVADDGNDNGYQDIFDADNMYRVLYYTEY